VTGGHESAYGRVGTPEVMRDRAASIETHLTPPESRNRSRSVAEGGSARPGSVPPNTHPVDVGAFDALSVQVTDRHDGLDYSMPAALFDANYGHAG
jgi:hypothetical protein